MVIDHCLPSIRSVREHLFEKDGMVIDHCLPSIRSGHFDEWQRILMVIEMRFHREVTVEQLLAHVGGLSTDCPPSIWKDAYRNQGKMPATEQRMEFVKDLLKEKADYKPGSKTVYSNQGYAVVGVILENSGKHGVGGWLVHDEKRFGGHALQMTGSNTMWYALLWIIPGHGKAILVTTNAASENAFASCDQVAAALMSYR